jgi:16S rRNA (cytosine1402-N4)-methyltransferase
MHNNHYHTPVLLSESIEALNINPSGTYLDLTFGGGGHSKAIIEKLSSKGRLLAFDQDNDAQQIAQTIAQTIESPNFTFIKANFKFVKQFLHFHNLSTVDGILADLGVSSHQIDTPTRGFAIRHNANLDMRMNQDQVTTAEHIINTYNHRQLTDMFNQYGEIKNTYKLVTTIIEHRKKNRITTTHQLKEIVEPLAPSKREYKYLAKVFQAIRIAINDELQCLQDMLTTAPTILNPQGRLVIISYHSLEDTLVKNFIKKGNTQGIIVKDIYGNIIRPLKPLHLRAIKPSQQEINQNNRARSARLRIAEKE